MSSDATCPLKLTGDQVDVDPMLGPLTNNGGSTPTRARADELPAVDAGNAAICPALDQRGFGRLADGDDDGNASCDVGAFGAGDRRGL